jgi:hypothetical protein
LRRICARIYVRAATGACSDKDVLSDRERRTLQ